MLKEKLQSMTQDFLSSILSALSGASLAELAGGGDAPSGKRAKSHGSGEGAGKGKKKRASKGSVDARCKKLVEFLKAHRTKTGHTTAELCAAVSLSRNQWKPVIERAKSEKHVVQKGKKRSARYFYKV